MSRQSYSLSTSCCHVATSDRGCAGAEAVPNRKPRSEWHGWETSFKQALLLRAEGAIRAFFDGYCRGDIASGVRNVAITRRHHTHFHYLCGYAFFHSLIVRGNCEAFGVRGGTIPCLSSTISSITYYTTFSYFQHTLYLRFCTVRCIVYTTDTYTQKPPSTIVFDGFVSAKYSSVLNFAPCTMLSASTFVLCRFRPRCRCCPRFEARLRATP